MPRRTLNSSSSRGRLETTVAPLNESLKQMNLRVQEADRARAQSYGAVARQLSDLSDRTTSLATALLRSPRPRTVRQIQPKRVGTGRDAPVLRLRRAGHDDDRGRTAAPRPRRSAPRRQAGRRRRQSAAQRLPRRDRGEGRRDKSPKLADHARQVRDHIGLSQKAYWQQFADSPDYVIMFLPDEGFFRAAWEQDNGSRRARGAVSRARRPPTTLLRFFRRSPTAGSRNGSRRTQIVHDLGRKVYESLSVMGGHLRRRSGRALDRAVHGLQPGGRLDRAPGPLPPRLSEHVVSDKTIEPLEPITSQTAPLQAPELEQTVLEVLPRDANAA